MPKFRLGLSCWVTVVETLEFISRGRIDGSLRHWEATKNLRIVLCTGTRKWLRFFKGSGKLSRVSLLQGLLIIDNWILILTKLPRIGKRS